MTDILIIIVVIVPLGLVLVASFVCAIQEARDDRLQWMRFHQKALEKELGFEDPSDVLVQDFLKL